MQSHNKENFNWYTTSKPKRIHLQQARMQAQNIKQHKHKIHVQRKLHKHKNLQKQKHYVVKFQITKSDLKSQILG